VEVNTADKTTDADGHPSKDPDNRIDAENMNVDEPDSAPDCEEVNTVDKATDTNGHPSKDSDDRIDAENMNVDKPDMIHEFINK
jgi:hypothetical protein